MFDRIKADLKEVQKALYSNHVVSTVPPPSEGIELGDDPTQLCRIEYVTEAHLHLV
jgi:hypothetical protein